MSEIRRRKGPPPRPPGPPGPCNAGGIEGDLAAAVRADNGVGWIPILVGRPAALNAGKWPNPACMAAAKPAAALPIPPGGLCSFELACRERQNSMMTLY